MSQTATTGDNRTGIVKAGERAEEMQRGMDRFAPTSQGTTGGAGKVRVHYAKEGHRVGSVPPPGGLGGKAKAAVDKVKGARPVVLMDKLGERIAFERTGTRLYEALVSKHEAFGSFDGGPTREQLIEILEEEHRHFSMLTEAMRDLGGDPTAMTPSADRTAVVASGVQKVVTDPRTTLLESLEAILVAELADGDGWHALRSLAEGAGEKELEQRCAEAEAREAEHLEKVRGWVMAGAEGA